MQLIDVFFSVFLCSCHFTSSSQKSRYSSLLFYQLMLSFAEAQSANTPDQQKPWWCDGKVKMQLAKIYYNKGKLEDFVDTIFHPILETLNVEYANRKVHMIFSIYGFHVLLDEDVCSIIVICFVSTVFIPPFSIASILWKICLFVSFFLMPGLFFFEL